MGMMGTDWRTLSCKSCSSSPVLHVSALAGKPGRLDKAGRILYLNDMPEIATPEMLPGTIREAEEKPRSALEPGYLVICWNDPVNFMDYVTHVFQQVFHWPLQKARHHMLQVHQQGKSVLVRESLEKAEYYVHSLQKYTLHATMERDE